jgi:hypothetical protein
MSYSDRPIALINVASLLTRVVVRKGIFCLLWVVRTFFRPTGVCEAWPFGAELKFSGESQ